MATEKEIARVKQYTKDNYDRISFYIPKGRKEELLDIAQARNIRNSKGQLSINQMIIIAIEEKYHINLARNPML